MGKKWLHYWEDNRINTYCRYASRKLAEVVSTYRIQAKDTPKPKRQKDIANVKGI